MQGLQKYHHYESIESASGTTTSVSENVSKSIAGGSDIKKFYREIRPGCGPVVKQPGDGVGKNMQHASNHNTEVIDVKYLLKKV